MLRIAALSAAVTVVILGVMYPHFSGEPDGVPVVVADRYRRWHKITHEMVEVAHVPNEDIEAGADTDPAPVVGRVTKVALVPGEQVAPSKLLRISGGHPY